MGLSCIAAPVAYLLANELSRSSLARGPGHSKAFNKAVPERLRLGSSIWVRYRA